MKTFKPIPILVIKDDRAIIDYFLLEEPYITEYFPYDKKERVTIQSLCRLIKWKKRALGKYGIS
ncbi:MAG: hypothetical protein OEY47_01390 [Candidatus Bathyarchaeota archaeon]|nr:hypothetical protein [Candidatus Bathyarchaeota archaeon]